MTTQTRSKIADLDTDISTLKGVGISILNNGQPTIFDLVHAAESVKTIAVSAGIEYTAQGDVYNSDDLREWFLDIVRSADSMLEDSGHDIVLEEPEMEACLYGKDVCVGGEDIRLLRILSAAASLVGGYML
jgi:hypothetical protein